MNLKPVVAFFAIFFAMAAGLDSPIRADFVLTDQGVALVEDFQDFRGAGFDSDPGAGQLDSDAWAANGFSSTTDLSRGESTGSVTTGGVYAFETTGSFINPNYTLGAQASSSDFTDGDFELTVQNGTGKRFDVFEIAYDTYVFNDQNRSNFLQMEYSIDGGASYTEVAASRVVSDEAAAGGGFGSASWELTSFNARFDFGDENVAAGGSFLIRFRGDDVSGSGSRDEFAIDNVSVSAQAVPDVSSLLLLSVGSFGAWYRQRRRKAVRA